MVCEFHYQCSCLSVIKVKKQHLKNNLNTAFEEGKTTEKIEEQEPKGSSTKFLIAAIAFIGV